MHTVLCLLHLAIAHSQPSPFAHGLPFRLLFSSFLVSNLLLLSVVRFVFLAIPVYCTPDFVKEPVDRICSAKPGATWRNNPAKNAVYRCLSAMALPSFTYVPEFPGFVSRFVSLYARFGTFCARHASRWPNYVVVFFERWLVQWCSSWFSERWTCAICVCLHPRTAKLQTSPFDRSIGTVEFSSIQVSFAEVRFGQSVILLFLDAMTAASLHCVWWRPNLWCPAKLVYDLLFGSIWSFLELRKPGRDQNNLTLQGRCRKLFFHWHSSRQSGHVPEFICRSAIASCEPERARAS